jgi:enoyl-[acyl-carrier protein] reductase I
MTAVIKAKLLEGKRGLVVGIANDQSIAWGCAKAFRAFGAEVAVTYLNDKARKYVEPLARELEAPIVMPLDVNVPGQMEAVFERISREWDKLDFMVHSIAFSPKSALQGRVVDVDRDGFLTTMDVSCWTFIRMAHLAEPLMRKGGTLFTMTYYGSQMVVKNYNIMGVAKAALESAVRYLAAELGPKGIRVHAISPGPLATRAASGIPEFDALLDKAKGKAPTRSLVSIDDVGVATAFLAHDAARLITGETLYIDGGYHTLLIDSRYVALSRWGDKPRSSGYATALAIPKPHAGSLPWPLSTVAELRWARFGEHISEKHTPKVGFR